MPAKRVSAKASPVNLPAIIILAIMVLGLAVAVKLVDIKQIFSPKAGGSGIEFFGDGVSTNSQGQKTTTSPTVKVRLTSPYTSDNASKSMPQPDYEDSLATKSKHAFPEFNIDGELVRNSYKDGAYLLDVGIGHYSGDEFNKGKGNMSAGVDLKKVNIDFQKYSIVFDFNLQGSDSNEYIGFYTGGDSDYCTNRLGANCYRLTISQKGIAELDYKGRDNYSYRESIRKEQKLISLEDNKWYTARVDKQDDKVSLFISPDNGNSWMEIARDWAIDPGKNRVQNTNFFGFAIGQDLVSNNKASGGTKAYFKNFKVWKYGKLSVPGTPGYYRYSATQGDIEGDSNGDRVKWQAMSSNPIEVSQTYSSEQGAKYFFAQFKDNNGKVSEVYASKILLGSDVQCVKAPCPGDTVPSTPKTYSACGKSGTLASNYEPLTTCNPGTYLVVEQSENYLEPTCRAIPPGFVRDLNDVCKIVSTNSLNPSNPCLSQAGFACGDSNGATRGGKSCGVYQSSFNTGCASDNVYPYCWSSCN